MKFDMDQVPFSMRGSYMAVSRIKENFLNLGNQEGLYFRTVHAANYLPNVTLLRNPTFSVRLVPFLRVKETEEKKGQQGCETSDEKECSGQIRETVMDLPYRTEADPSMLCLITGYGEIRMCFADTDTILVEGCGKNLGLRLEMIPGGYCYHVAAGGNPHILLNCAGSSRRFLLRAQQGSTELHKIGKEAFCRIIEAEADENGTFLFGLEDIEDEWNRDDRTYDFEKSSQERRDEFEQFVSAAPQVPEAYQEAARLALYINWSCLVKPQGSLTREAMLMAKNWMCNVWSWDHCFNAIALAKHDPKLAWDQFMVLFDYQKPSGRIPDSISDAYALWNFCKPPIHGWALSKLMQEMQLTMEQYEEAYRHISAWTQWWLDYRDSDQDGICEYHHGNDSGWDNATAFREEPAVELPDLAAYLTVQMDVLAHVAELLGKTEEAAEWKEKANTMLTHMLEHCFEHGLPVARVSGSHRKIENDSLLPYVSVLLGKRLPEPVRTAMIRELKSDRFLTGYGFATEAVKSQWYHPDGYWRGPIWAPSTMLLIEGLKSCGEETFAADVAKRFCDMAAKSGCAENFNALTGEGLRDRAYTWTSSVFLIYARELA